MSVSRCSGAQGSSVRQGVSSDMLRGREGAGALLGTISTMGCPARHSRCRVLLEPLIVLHDVLFPEEIPAYKHEHRQQGRDGTGGPPNAGVSPPETDSPSHLRHTKRSDRPATPWVFAPDGVSAGERRHAQNAEQNARTLQELGTRYPFSVDRAVRRVEGSQEQEKEYEGAKRGS